MLVPCLASAPSKSAAANRRGGFMDGGLPAIDDAEGDRVPPDLPAVVDAHVHLFPPRLFEAIWRWFDEYGWPIRYKLYARDVIGFLLSRGLDRVVALTYAHKPGIARDLNRFMAEMAQDEPRVIALGTVFPGEPEARAIVEEGFALGLAGIKLHCHVQCMSADAESLDPVYAACSEANRPVVIHAGREPKSERGYRCDPHELCSADRLEAVLRSFPRLRVCVPHLGADEFSDYGRLLERYDNLWLDTTMTLADYFPGPAPIDLLRVRPARVMYGTDFPNLPFAWDRELTRLARLGLPPDHLAALVGDNARHFFDAR